MHAGRPRDVASLLRAAGLRVTPQRRAVWGAFDHGRACHLTAEQILALARREVPEISRGTVYNALADFVAAGLIATVDVAGSQLYDPNVASHQHFRCRSCKRLYDVHPSGLDQVRLEDNGFVLERVAAVFEGVCPRCADGV